MGKITTWYCGDYDDHLHLARTIPHIGMFATVKFGILLRPYRVVWMAHMHKKVLLWPWGKDGQMMQTFRHLAIMCQQRADESWRECDVSLPNSNPIEFNIGKWKD